ncbi:MAG: hypothetical protein U0805_12390 [Pirellulales bacterium]
MPDISENESTAGVLKREIDRMRLHRLFAQARRCVLPGTLLLLAAAIAGCSGKPDRGKIAGIVKVDGQPASGVQLIFYPVGGTPEFQRVRPMGLSQSDGTFIVNTTGGGDGAPPGQYKVLLSWAAPARGPARDGAPTPGGDRLQGRYNNPETTPFNVEIKSGSNDLPPFELKSK